MGLFFAKVRTFHRFCTHFAGKITKFNYNIARQMSYQGFRYKQEHTVRIFFLRDDFLPQKCW